MPRLPGTGGSLRIPPRHAPRPLPAFGCPWSRGGGWRPRRQQRPLPTGHREGTRRRQRVLVRRRPEEGRHSLAQVGRQRWGQALKPAWRRRHQGLRPQPCQPWPEHLQSARLLQQLPRRVSGAPSRLGLSRQPAAQRHAALLLRLRRQQQPRLFSQRRQLQLSLLQQQPRTQQQRPRPLPPVWQPQQEQRPRPLLLPSPPLVWHAARLPRELALPPPRAALPRRLSSPPLPALQPLPSPAAALTLPAPAPRPVSPPQLSVQQGGSPRRAPAAALPVRRCPGALPPPSR